MDRRQNCRILQWNCRSLRPNLQYLVHFLSTQPHEVLCIQSPNCTPHNLPHIEGYYYPPVYGLFMDRDKVGTVTYIKRGISYNKLPLCLKDISNVAASCAIQLIDRGHPFKLANIYYPTPDPEFQWLHKFHSPKWVVVGDFNIHDPLWSDHLENVAISKAQEHIMDSPLVVLNDGSITRLPDSPTQRPSAIDLSLATADLASDADWSIWDEPLGSDHLPITIRMNFGISEDPPVCAPTFNYKKASWDLFKERLNASPIDSPGDLSATELCSKITDNVLAAAGYAIPRSKPPRPRTRNNPWWNAHCEQAVAEKRAACRRYRKCNTPETHADMIAKKAASNKAVAEAKKAHWDQYVKGLETGTSLTDVWNKVKQMKQKFVLPDPPLQQGDHVYTTHEEKAEAMADFLAANSNASGLTPDELLHRQNYETDNPLQDPPTDDSDPLNQPVTMTELKRALAASTKTKVSAGADEITYLMLRELTATYMEYVHILFQKCWDQGAFPEAWKHAVVTPIPKKGKPRRDLGSYRPISLTSHLGKVYERIVKNRLEHFCDKHGVLPLCQAGFRKGRSVTDHLVMFSTHMRKALSWRRTLLSCFFDIHRAYDSVWHHRLLEKIQKLGINGPMYQFIKHFLSGRKMQVRWRGSLSTSRDLSMGVPQGSVIAPLLFIIMLHDVTTTRVDGCVLTLYADDIAVWRFIPTLRRPRSLKRSKGHLKSFQRQLQRIADYLRENGFRLSTEKTQYMVVNRWGQIPNDDFKMDIDDAELLPTDKVKYLGVTFDRRGVMAQHIKSNIVSACKAVNLIKMVSQLPWANNPKTMVILTQSLVRSRLLYGMETSFEMCSTLLNKLEVTECKALKTALGLPAFTPKELAYREAGLLPLRHYITLMCAKYTLRAQTVPNSIGEELSSQFPKRGKLSGQASIHSQTLDLKVTAGVDNAEVATRPKHPYPPWMLERPRVNLDMAGISKSDNPLYSLTIAREFIQNQFRNSLCVYTDGSADDAGAGAAFCIPDMGKIHRRYHLPRLNIFTVELTAILMALTYISDLPRLPISVTVLSDSKSALAAIESDAKSSREDIVIEILTLAHQLIVRGCDVQLQWVPAHIGLAGNEMADRFAKQAAANLHSETIPLKHSLSDLQNLLAKGAWRLWVDEFTKKTGAYRAIDPSPPSKSMVIPSQASTHLARFIYRMRCGVWKCMFAEKLCKCGMEFLSPQHLIFDCRLYQNHFSELTDRVEALGLPRTLPSVFIPATHGWGLAVLTATLVYTCDVAAYL